MVPGGHGGHGGSGVLCVCVCVCLAKKASIGKSEEDSEIFSTLTSHYLVGRFQYEILRS